MMPLMFANTGETNIIKKVGGSPEVKKHLENLGFVAGGEVTIISSLGGNVIARDTVKALRKDVLAKCYGGDVTRKK